MIPDEFHVYHDLSLSADNSDSNSIALDRLTFEFSIQLESEVIEKEMTTNDVWELEGPSTSVENKPLGEPNKDETIL